MFCIKTEIPQEICEIDDVLIDFSATTTTSDLNDFDGLITFVEIV
ncbi:MAG: hypothetical protein QF530_13670 [SAR202 cluster bacterium]|nr:hypothetical protein [SAR202 cluster bacterium]